MKECLRFRPQSAYEGKQGFSYVEGISRENAKTEAICMHLVTVPPGGRAKAHKHATHETTIFVLEGGGAMFWGERLENRMEFGPGDLIYIPADVPHLAFNPTDQTMRGVVARTDPHEQESVVLLPELEGLVAV